MKTAFAIATLAVVTTSLAIGHIVAQTEKKWNEKTVDNLSTAMHGEALAYAKYLLFAQHARKDGNTELALLFEKTAKTERLEHFAAEAKLARMVGTDADNLKDAIKGENYEATTCIASFLSRPSRLAIIKSHSG